MLGKLDVLGMLDVLDMLDMLDQGLDMLNVMFISITLVS